MDTHPEELIYVSRMSLLIGELEFLLEGNAQKKSPGYDRTEVKPETHNRFRDPLGSRFSRVVRSAQSG